VIYIILVKSFCFFNGLFNIARVDLRIQTKMLSSWGWI
jgi:hypothetical protein